MKKILFACDGKYFPAGAFEFVKELNQSEKVLLTGVFLHAFNFKEFLPGVYAMYAGPVEEFLESEKQEREQNILHFKELCLRNEIEFRVHEESMNWNIEELARESRFADLMLMSEELFCNGINDTQPNSFMQQAIHKAECPVICIPEKYTPFKKIVFAYDGKKDSMFALKQFCNLFPQFTANETRIVYAKADHDNDIPDLSYLEEFAGRHFRNLDIEKAPENGTKYFENEARKEKDILLVAGSYGRSGISNTFKKSFVEEIIHDHNIPVFIAHN